MESYSKDKQVKIELAKIALSFLETEIENGMYAYLKDDFDRLAFLIDTEKQEAGSDVSKP